MTFEKFYSSSRANLYTVTAANGRRLLIECGVTWKKLQKAIGYDLKTIDGCVLSHEHFDHSKCVEDVLAAGIDVYASEGTFKSIEESLHLHHRAHILRDRRLEKIGQFFDILPFNIHHDATEPLGFIMHENTKFGHDESLLFGTDTSHLTQCFAVPFSIVALSCNYDKDLVQKRLEAGKIDESVAKRLLSSHMEWRVTKRYLKEFCNLSQCREIYLLHSSAENIDKKMVRETFENELFIKTII